MNDHLTDDELRDFLRHRLAPAKIGLAARHLAQCPSCAAAAREGYDVAAASRAVEAAAAPPASSIRFRLAAAAALVLCVAGLAGWLAHTSSAPVPIAAAAPPDPWTPIAAAAHARGEVAMPDVLRALRPPHGTLRGTLAQAATTRSWPAGEVVEDERVELRWDAVPHRTSYRVLLFQGTTPFAESAPLTRRAWQPERPLERGVDYEWQLLAKTPDGELAIPAPPAAPALFRVLPSREHDRLDAARRAHPGDRLLLGVLYAEAGVVGRALEELRAYANAHPNDEQGQKLLRSVESWTPH